MGRAERIDQRGQGGAVDARIVGARSAWSRNAAVAAANSPRFGGGWGSGAALATAPPSGRWQKTRVLGGSLAAVTVLAAGSAGVGCGSKSAICCDTTRRADGAALETGVVFSRRRPWWVAAGGEGKLVRVPVRLEAIDRLVPGAGWRGGGLQRP